jgi:alkanesulfonate monooxygenase SsuD/methylene tetrahydromethanopterin reductase-like flavin-dependent oxidoreductase (luciferase family)
MTADLKFGVNVDTSAADPVADARFAEELGFDFVSSSDHPGSDDPVFETWTMLTWMAAGTTRISLLPRVLGLPFRRPPLVAKMAETFDRLSGGRLILGLGGGGSEAELRSLGIDPGRRITGLDEGIQIIRGMWSQPAFSFDGAVHQVDGAELEPKPARRIPIWLGTFGPRALELTGRVADGWIPTLGYVSEDELPALRDQVVSAARAAGRAPEELDCILNVEIGIAGYCEPEDDMVTGTPEEIADQLARLAAIGFNGFNFIQAGHSPREQLERIASEVLPAVRGVSARS